MEENLLEGTRPFTPADLSFEPFQNSSAVQGFVSGDPEIDDFLNTYEVAEYKRLNLGETTLVYCQGEVVGFYTLSTEVFKVEYFEKHKHFNEPDVLNLDAYPAVKIGRFAVREDLSRRGLGSLIMSYILATALTWPSGAQYVVVNSTELAIPFYEKMGFKLSLHKSNPHLHQRVLFYNLDALQDSLDNE